MKLWSVWGPLQTEANVVCWRHLECVGGRCYWPDSGANSINQHDSLLCFAVESAKI